MLPNQRQCRQHRGRERRRHELQDRRVQPAVCHRRALLHTRGHRWQGGSVPRLRRPPMTWKPIVAGIDSDWALPCAVVFLVDVMLLAIYVGMTSRP